MRRSRLAFVLWFAAIGIGGLGVLPEAASAALPLRPEAATRVSTVARPGPVVPKIWPGLGWSPEQEINPPDVQLAVGPSAVVEMVNNQAEIWDRTGLRLQPNDPESLGSFFSTEEDDRSADEMTDPRVLYDALSGHWFAAVLDVSRLEIVVGASLTDDPAGEWWLYTFPFDDCPDYPRLGVSNRIVVFSVNLYSQGCHVEDAPFIGAQVALLDKADMLAGRDVGTLFEPIPGTFVDPAISLSATDVQWLVTVDADSSSAYVVSVSDPDQDTIPTGIPLPLAPIVPPPPAPQPGTTTRIDAGDNRVQTAVWERGVLWFSAGDGCAIKGPFRACGRIAAIATALPRVIEERELFLDGGRSLFYPTIFPDRAGNLAVVFGYSSPTEYGSLGVRVKPRGKGFSPWFYLKRGTAPNLSGRYGDYFGAARDPIAPNRLWFAGEFAAPGGEQQGWGTVIAPVTVRVK
jgi:hypothetical protein